MSSAGAPSRRTTSGFTPSAPAAASARSTVACALSGRSYVWTISSSLAFEARASVAATCSALSAKAEPSVARTMRL